MPAIACKKHVYVKINRASHLQKFSNNLGKKVAIQFMMIICLSVPLQLP